jgi:hypothetical protein
VTVDDLLAREAIRDLVARYAVAIDSRDLDTLVSLFVDRGRDRLRADFEASLRGIGVSILQVGTHVIDLAGPDDATGVVYCTCEVQDGDRWVRQAILYRDTYRREDGAWRFVRRVHELWYGAEQPTNPLDQAPANWPASSTGLGTVPASWPSWGRFWEGG